MNFTIQIGFRINIAIFAAHAKEDKHTEQKGPI